MTTTVGTDIDIAAAFLRAGELVGMPTETVYGLAASVALDEAIKKVFQTKNRPFSNPLIVHVAQKSDLEWVSDKPFQLAKDLVDEFWPGPLTIILFKSDRISTFATAGSSSLAVRMPAAEMALSLIQKVGAPLVAPSANPFTRISPTTAIQVKDYFDGKIPYVLDGGKCTIGIESTIIKVNENNLQILREGAITAQHLSKYPIIQNDHSVHHPGNYKKHYAPNTPLRMVKSIKEATKKFPTESTVLILFGQHSDFRQYRTIQLSEEKKLEEAASNLYSAMSEADSMGASVILIEPFPDQGIGKALNERLRKAAINNLYE